MIGSAYNYLFTTITSKPQYTVMAISIKNIVRPCKFMVSGNHNRNSDLPTFIRINEIHSNVTIPSPVREIYIHEQRSLFLKSSSLKHTDD